MKSAARISSYLLVLVIGAVVGYYLGYRVTEARSFAVDISEVAYYSAYMSIQMNQGTDATREVTLRDFVARNEKRKLLPGRWITERMIAVDTALAYARLAALARKRDSMQEADEYLSRAVLFCPQMGWQECSAESINNVIQRLDKEGIFGEKSTKGQSQK
jgi:hypothetical protein